jgi:hypothetical protein
MVLVYDNDCAGTSGDITVTQGTGSVTVPTISSITGNYILCDTESAILLEVTNATAFTAPTYQWFKENSAIGGAMATLLIVTEAGNYHVMVMDGECSAQSQTKAVSGMTNGIPIAQPLLTTEPNTTELCGQGAVVLLSVSNAAAYSVSAQYIWITNNTIVQTSPYPHYFATQTGDYQVLVEDNGCSALSDSLSLSLGSINITTPVVLCNQNTSNLCEAYPPLTLTVINANQYSVGTVYVWYNDFTEVQRSSNNVYEVAAPGNYYVMVIDGDCASLSNEFTFTQNMPPLTQDPCIGCNDCNPSTIEISCISVGNQNLVINDLINLTYLHTGNDWNVTAVSNALPVTFTYQLTGATTGTGSSLDNVAFNMGLTTITWNATNAYNNSSSCSFTVNVYAPTPCIGCDSAGRSCTTIGNPSVCMDNSTSNYLHSGDSWDITATDITGIDSIVYTLSGATAGSGYSLDNVTFNAGITTVTWTAYNGAGGSATCSFTVTVNSLPGIFTILDKYYCTGMSIGEVWLGISPNAQYSWSMIAGDNIGLSATGNGPLSAFTAINTTDSIRTAIYQLVATDMNTGCIAMDTLSISVFPTATIDSIHDVVLCNNDAFTLNFTGQANHFAWHKIGGDNIADIPINGTGNIDIPAVHNALNRPLFALYEVVAGYVYDQNICTGHSVTFTVIVNPTAELTSPLQTDTICSGDNFHYEATSNVQGVSYQWTRIVVQSNINGGTSSSGNTPIINEILNNTGTTIVPVTYRFELLINGCLSDSVATVTVNVKPDIQFSINPVNDVCTGRSQISIPFTSPGADMYYTIEYPVASRLAGFISVTTPVAVNGSEIVVELPNGLLAGGYQGILHITAYGCEKSESFIIRVLTNVHITRQPISVMLCDSADGFELNVVAEGSALTYQWYFNESAIPGATGSEYRVPQTDSLYMGSYYVIVSNGCSSEMSNPIKVSFNTIVLKTKWDDIIYVSNANGNFVAYQWYKDGDPIGINGNYQSYMQDGGLNGTYSVMVTYKDGTRVMSCPMEASLISKKGSLLVYPNPNKPMGNLTIDLSSLFSTDWEVRGTKIELTDAQGRLIQAFRMDNLVETVLLDNISHGFYLLRIITPAKEVFTEKIVIN